MVKTGLNGNHLSWEFIDTSNHDYNCIDCKQGIEEEKERIEEMFVAGEISEDEWNDKMERIEEVYHDYCTNHTYEYQFNTDGFTGKMFYDSNMNTVALYGYIPYDVLNDEGKEYLKRFHSDDYFFVDGVDGELIYVRDVIH